MGDEGLGVRDGKVRLRRPQASPSLQNKVRYLSMEHPGEEEAVVEGKDDGIDEGEVAGGTEEEVQDVVVAAAEIAAAEMIAAAADDLNY